MEFCVERDKLLTAMNRYLRVSENKNSPVTKKVLIVVEGNDITLTTYNLHYGAKVAIKATEVAKQKISIAVEYALLQQCLSKFGESIVFTLNPDEHCVTLKSGRKRTTLNYVEGDTFPALPEIQGDNIISIPKEQFVEGVKATLFCVNADEYNKKMQGLNIVYEDERLCFKAIDGVRFASFDIKVNADCARNVFSAIIEKEVASFILGVLEKSNTENIVISRTQSHMLVEADNVQVVSTILTGDNFNFKPFLLASKTGSFEINKADFLDAIETVFATVEIVAKNPVKLVCKDNTIHLSSKSSYGASEAECDVVSEGEPIEIGFNAKYLYDTIKSLDVDKIKVDYKNSVSQVEIHGKNDDIIKSMALLLPVRIK